jgi:hypothetical protein
MLRSLWQRLEHNGLADADRFTRCVYDLDDSDVGVEQAVEACSLIVPWSTAVR